MRPDTTKATERVNGIKQALAEFERKAAQARAELRVALENLVKVEEAQEKYDEQEAAEQAENAARQ